MKYILFALGFFAQASLCAEPLETLLALNIGRTAYGYGLIEIYPSLTTVPKERKAFRAEKKRFLELYATLRVENPSLPVLSSFVQERSRCEALALNIHKQLKKAKS